MSVAEIQPEIVITSIAEVNVRALRSQPVRVRRHVLHRSPPRSRDGSAVTYAFGGGSSGAGTSARGARSDGALATMTIGADDGEAIVRAPTGAATHEASAAQQGVSVARSVESPLECCDDGAQLACAEVAVRASPRGVLHAAAVPTMMKCAIASRASIPSGRRRVM